MNTQTIPEFPTHVGMNRPRLSRKRQPPRVPHTRGDEPAFDHFNDIVKMSSPHTWG